MLSRHRFLRIAAAACCGILASTAVQAQSTVSLTLEQALEMAEARSEALDIARAGIRRAEGDQVRARSGLLPQLSASASYDRTLATEFANVFGGGSGPTCPGFQLNPSGALADRVAEIERAIDCGAIGNPFSSVSDDSTSQLPFGRENTWRLNFVFSQNLYSGGRLGAQRTVAALGRESAEQTLTSARAQLLFNVTQAYYDAALSDRLVEIAQATLQQSEATVRQVEAGFNAGAQPEFELLRARVARDNQAPPLIRQRANREIAMLRLKDLLEVPAQASLELAASLGDEALPPPPVFAPLVASIESTMNLADPLTAAMPSADALPDRLAVREVATQVRTREATLHATEAERKPSVTLNSAYGRVAYPSGVVPSFGDFRTNWTVGASVQLPILTGGRQRGNELIARADLEQARARLEQVGEQAEVDTRTAWAELLAARASWAASAGTIRQATRAYEIADVRYRAGVSTQLELSDARLLLQQSEANRAQAARDLQVARARVALLPNLPIAATGSGVTTPAAPPSVPAPAPTPQTPANGATGGQMRAAGAQSGFTQTGGQQ
jgi:outer membrane protein TolC